MLPCLLALIIAIAFLALLPPVMAATPFPSHFAAPLPPQCPPPPNTGFSSCIIAAPQLLPSAILDAVLPLLAPSATFVIFSPYMQPLAEALHELTISKRAVMLQLSESWTRPYQVGAVRCSVLGDASQHVLLPYTAGAFWLLWVDMVHGQRAFKVLLLVLTVSLAARGS